jgi:Flp pilus assembly protein TadG
MGVMKQPGSFHSGRSDDGAILIQVASALLVFSLLSAYVIDYGVQLVGRHHIQNAVDSAALAGATALAFDSYTDRGDGGIVKTTVQSVAEANLVWSNPAVVSNANITFPACPDSFDAGPSATPIFACVRVEATQALPTYVAQMMGMDSMNVAAAATAQARDANATDCLKPLAIPDRWVERYPVNPGMWAPSSTFDKWNPAIPTELLTPQPDSYTPPTSLSSGSGMKITVEFGASVVLTQGVAESPVTTIQPWRYLSVQIPDSVQGANNVRANLEGCAASSVAINDRLNLVPATAAEIADGLQTLIDRDPGATWNAAGQRIVNSCADTWPRCASMSPRLIALPVYDLHDLADASRGGATSIKVRNFVGFFVETVDPSTGSATGRIARHPGQINPGAPILIDASTFLRASLLVK